MILFNDLPLVEGKSYLLKAKRTNIEFKSVDGWFYEINEYVTGKPPKIKEEDRSWITFKNLPSSFRLYSGCPKESGGIKIICMDDDEVIFDGGPNKRKKKK